MGELAGAIVLGIGATITPCILPLYPAFLAYLTAASTAGRRFPPAAAAALVWAGVVVGMVIIGAAFAVLATPLGDFIRVVLPIADGGLILLGVLLLLGRNPFARLPQLSPAVAGRGGPAVGAFLYGLLFAPIAVPCSGPFLIVIFAYSLTIGDAAGQLAFFLAFGIGFGLPLFVIGLLDQLSGARLARSLVRWERALQLVLGAALVVIGAWDLAVNLPNLLA
ncbi:MAG: cytochrome c biogenesis protein CcdA [Chloroflexota bacterium]